MNARRPPLLLVLTPPKPRDVHVQIPPQNDNLFERLIRDPQAPDRPMRERQCAEMLRCVLVASPTFRNHILKWLARLSGTPTDIVDELDWRMETEQSIGSKRDDLRIEGFHIDENGEPDRVVLWTVEIKVAAPLHESSRQDWGDQPVDCSTEETETVNQLYNYDSWLGHQQVKYRSGFVLALRDLSSLLPTDLCHCWECFTWTDLAIAAEQVLADDSLPPGERPLARHMLGFIRHRLWDGSDMANTRLELDDVALLRALAVIGPSCARKLKDLVNQFKEILEATGVGFLEIKPTSSFFDRSDSAQYSIGAKCASDLSWLSVSAGVVADDVRVWVSCNPTARKTKEKVRRLLNERQNELTDRNPSWVVVEASEPGFVDAEITRPLISVLAEDDWQSPLIEFVRMALADLKSVGILEALVQIQTENEKLT